MRDQSALVHIDDPETRRSWWIATASMLIMFVGWGAPYVVAVALKPIAAELAVPRSIPSLATSLAYIGSGVGGIFMGWWADRVGAMWPALLGSLMVGLGAIVASSGGVWQLYVGYGVMVGLLGNAGTFAPLMANTSRWFGRRRGTALALVASGQQIAGTVWPPIFRWGLDSIGWRATLVWYGIAALATMLPLCALLRHRPPPQSARAAAHEARTSGPPLGLPPNLVQGLLCAAIFCCCIAMVLPMAHLVAFCSDLGYAPARGAEMLSLLLGSAFLSRMLWGRLSDKLGGLRTVLIGTIAQAVFLSCYIFVDDLVLLYVVSAAFGIGFGGIIPSYVLALRDLFPASEAGWRIGALLLFGLGGMAVGAWLGGFIYDWFANYQPAFAVGVTFNLVTVVLVAGMVLRGARPRAPLPAIA